MEKKEYIVSYVKVVPVFSFYEMDNIVGWSRRRSTRKMTGSEVESVLDKLLADVKKRDGEDAYIVVGDVYEKGDDGKFHRVVGDVVRNWNEKVIRERG